MTEQATPQTVEEIQAWYERPRRARLPKQGVMELYFTFHPRTAFLKMLPHQAVVVDIGAGDGSLSVFRKWPEPARPDLEMHAYSLQKGRLFDDFASYELTDWNTQPPEFGGRMFDGIVCAHFIEHIARPASLVEWAARKLRSGGRLYLEWPAPASLTLPPRDVLERAGVNVMISRFDDDRTHRDLPDADAIVEAMRAAGLELETRGIVRLPWIEDEILAHHKDDEAGFGRQAAFWSMTGWSQYLVARRA